MSTITSLRAQAMDANHRLCGMATEDDCRLWITLSGTAVWED